MSKTKTLFTMALLVLLGSMGAAQAQNRFVVVEMVTQPAAAARAGGESEASGSIWLSFSTALAGQDTTVTVNYSVPLAMDIAPQADTDGGYTSQGNEVMIMGAAEDDDNDGNGTFTVSSLSTTPADTTLVVRNVPLDVSGASGPVTVTVEVESSVATDFVRFDGPNSGMVISDVVIGIDAEADSGTLRTRGGESTAELTLEEAFKGAFMTPRADATDAASAVTPLDLEIEFSGIPDGATLTAELVGIVIADGAEINPDNTDAYATVSAVSSDGTATVTLGGDDGEHERQGPDEVMLMLTLTAASSNDKISFPLDVGEVMAKVTFDGEGFVDAFTDYVAVFNIRPAQCTLLFPLVTYIPNPAGGDPLFNTGFAIVNPAYVKGAASGQITFTFYKQDTVPTDYTTNAGSPGTGLEPDGSLAPGSTYLVNASELLPAANWAELAGGHVHVRADYTNCNGVGLIYGTMGIDQSYTALVLDADTGVDE